MSHSQEARRHRLLQSSLADLPEQGWWDEHNARLDAALAKWMEAERQLAEAHINLARDLRADFERIEQELS